MAQQLKTQPVEAVDLPKLTSQQMLFAEGVALQGLTATQAYKNAYNTTNSKDTSIHCNASLLNTDINVSQWIFALRESAGYSPECRVEQHQTRLNELGHRAEKDGNYGAAVQAEQLRGKVAGHYADKQILTVKSGLSLMLVEISNALGGVTIDVTPEQEETIESTTYSLDDLTVKE